MAKTLITLVMKRHKKTLLPYMGPQAKSLGTAAVKDVI